MGSIYATDATSEEGWLVPSNKRSDKIQKSEKAARPKKQANMCAPL